MTEPAVKLLFVRVFSSIQGRATQSKTAQNRGIPGQRGVVLTPGYRRMTPQLYIFGRMRVAASKALMLLEKQGPLHDQALASS
jgi:hypothetical protein